MPLVHPRKGRSISMNDTMVLNYNFFIDLQVLHETGRLKDYDPRTLKTMDSFTLEELDRTVGDI